MTWRRLIALEAITERKKNNVYFLHNRHLNEVRAVLLSIFIHSNHLVGTPGFGKNKTNARRVDKMIMQ